MLFLRKTIAVLVAATLLLSACGQAEPETAPTLPPASSPASVSQSPASVPESAPPSSPAAESTDSAGSSSTPEAPAPWWRSELIPGSFLKENSRSDAVIWLYDNVSKLAYQGYETFSRDETTAFRFDLLTDTAQETETVGEPLEGGPFFEAIAYDGTRYTGVLCQTGVELSKALPGEEDSQTVKLQPSAEDYQAILDAVAQCSDSTKDARPAWLCMMRLSRCDTVTVTSADGRDRHTFSGASDWQTAYLFTSLRVPVTRESTRVSRDALLPDAATMELHFVNGLVYQVLANQTQLIVSASDMDYALRYTFVQERRYGWDAYARNEINPDT